jgi:N-acetylmuramoyl-L-alanine amidase
MRLLLLTIVFNLLCLLCNAQKNTDSLKHFYTSKIETILDKEKALQPYYTINDSGIFINAKTKGNTFYREFGVEWSKLDTVKKILNHFNDDSLLSVINSRNSLSTLGYSETNRKQYFENKKQLSGIKIAIDPGHIAGDMKTAVLEKKSLQFTYNNQTIAIAEGILTLQTALILKHLLEEQGAEVMLTRDKPNQTAFGITFKEWLEKDFKNAVDASFKLNEFTEQEKTFLLTKATQRDIFRTYFNNLDMRQRAKKINEFAPDLSVIIHYNVDEKNTGWKKPSDKNYNMIFTAGSFLKTELEKPIDRLSFFRLLLTDDTEQSNKLAENLITCFTSKLNVPAADSTTADYLSKYCIAESKGVYARNLTLTRLIKGVIIYGETLYQDNAVECMELSKTNTEVYGIKTSARVKQVADAYYEGIISYLKE